MVVGGFEVEVSCFGFAGVSWLMRIREEKQSGIGELGRDFILGVWAGEV